MIQKIEQPVPHEKKCDKSKEQKHISSTLSAKLDAINQYCITHELPIFIACKLPSKKKSDDGYMYGMVSPMRINLDIEKITNEKDRFPQFLGGILGFDRTQYYK